MPPAVTNAFKNWLKSNTGMKLSSDAAVTRLTYEGITDYRSLTDFDKKSLQSLPSICKETIPAIAKDHNNGIEAEAEVPGANLGSICVRRLIVAMNAAKYYTSINRAMNATNMHYTNVLSHFQLEWDDFDSLQDQDDPTVPSINDKDNDRKVIKWVPIFLDCLSRTFGSRGPLSYVLRDEVAVPPEADDPLDANSYYGASGSLLDKLIACLPHNGAIFKNDNATVYMLVEKSARGTSVESTVKTFSRRKDGRSAFFALISNHAGDTKYRSISKKRLHLLQNIKWNGRSFPLETHVSNHCSAHDDLRECANHITVSVPDTAQRIEYLIDSITCQDNTLQAVIGLVRANTNNMRNDFESAASAMIEVDPYKRSNKSNANQRTANISAIDFSAGRGSSGVDLRWHPHKEFKRLPEDQKNDLREWMKTQEGKKLAKQGRKAVATKCKTDKTGKDDKSDGDRSNGSWKKKMKRAMKTPQGLKSIMSVLAEEEQSNQGFIASLAGLNTPTTPSSSHGAVTLPPAPAPNPPAAPQVSALQTLLPATSVKLASILKNKKE